MNSLLVINASGRVTRSVTRSLTSRFADAWMARHPDGEIVSRDIGQQPPPPINESWIAAGFTDPAQRTPAMLTALTTSETLIEEIFCASAVVVGVPMYNFGMPAQLKAYVDQIVRVGRTFDFKDPDDGNPYQPLVPTKPVAILTSTGSTGYEPGGPVAHLNFLEPHITAVFGFIGLTNLSFIRIHSEESKNEQFQQSMAAAAQAIEDLADRWTNDASSATRTESIAEVA